MYSKKWINVVLLIIAIIIFLIINIIWNNLNLKSVAVVETITKENIREEQSEEHTEDLNEKSIEVTDENKAIEEKNKNWKIEIPAISLIAEISEGTDEETLNKYVGHFIITQKTEGNIGLAAHNRGYPVNYFENLKNLEGGEEIIYTYGEFSKTYVVKQNIKISDIDWSYLENSKENKITLITCISNEPAYRRCVQATEKEE